MEIVQFDEALTASLLRSANSSWSSSRGRDHDRAGRRDPPRCEPGARHDAGPQRPPPPRRPLPQYGLGEGELWRHSVAASLAAELLAPRAAPPPAARGGDRRAAPRRRQARDGPVPRVPPCSRPCGQHRSDGRDPMDAEAEVLGTDHAELGGLIARSWSLPESLVRGIREHGRPRTDGDTLVHAVYLSDVLAKAVGRRARRQLPRRRARRRGVRPGDGRARPRRGRLRRAPRAGRRSAWPRSRRRFDGRVRRSADESSDHRV